MNGINKITDKILAEAKAAEAAALDDARRRAAEILAAAEDEADEIRDRIVERAAKEGENIISRAKSSASMTRRNTFLAARGALIDDVFEQAFAQVRALPAEEYRELLVKLLSDSLIQHLASIEEVRALDGDDVEEIARYEVVLNAVDRRSFGETLVADTRRALTGRVPAEEAAKLCLADDTAAISGGVVLRFGDVESNCSFETLFAQVRARREAEVSRILFG